MKFTLAVRINLPSSLKSRWRRQKKTQPLDSEERTFLKKKPSSCVVARRRVIIKRAKKGELFIWLEFKQVRKKGPPVNPSTFMGTKPAAADCQLRHWQTELFCVCIYDLSFPSDAVAFFYSELMYYSWSSPMSYKTNCLIVRFVWHGTTVPHLPQKKQQSIFRCRQLVYIRKDCESSSVLLK